MSDDKNHTPPRRGENLAVLDADREIATLDPLHIVAIKDLPAKRNGAAKR